MRPKEFRPILTKSDPSKKSLSPAKGYSGHEDELYNVATAKFCSSPRPVGLRPAGRFLSFSVDGHEKPTFGVSANDKMKENAEEKM